MSNQIQMVLQAGLLTLSAYGMTFILLHTGYFQYGITVFLAIPFIIGFVNGKSAFKKEPLLGTLIGLFFLGVVLLVFKYEGVICVLFSAPIVTAAMAVGLATKVVFLKIKNNEDNRLSSTAFPLLLLMTSYAIEHHFYITSEATNVVSTSMSITSEKEATLNYILSMGQIKTSKSPLMYLGLPEPQECIMKFTDSDTIRYCHFEGGYIAQSIAEYHPGQYAKFDIIEYQLVGRKWLGFISAGYQIIQDQPNRYTLIRDTEYTSSLKPRWYWQPLEEWGIKEEHEYVFRAISDHFSQ